MRNKLIIVIALVCGLLAAFLVYNYLNNVNKEADQRVYTQVVIAAKDIPANTTLTAEMVELKPFPSELMNNYELIGVPEAVGKLAIIPIKKGEVLLQNHLVKPGENTDQLSYVVPEGFKAISVPVDEVSGVGYMVKRGDRVDIISVIDGGDASIPSRSLVVLQDIEVLAIGTELTPASVNIADKPKTYTLAVSLADSLKLNMAIQKGSITLLLRSPADKTNNAPAPFGLNQF
jgi:pilus assembly protein CpaB